MLAVDRADVDRVCSALTAAGIETTAIGRVRAPEHGVLLKIGPGDHSLSFNDKDSAPGATVELPTFERDEIARLFE